MNFGWYNPNIVNKKYFNRFSMKTIPFDMHFETTMADYV